MLWQLYLLMQRFLAFLTLLTLFPVWIILYIAVTLESQGGFIFQQSRMGKKKRRFTLYKIRTMKINAEKLQKKLLPLNEVTGPVFKIRHDPRFTHVGKYLSHTGLDELPQLINIMKGEMAFVGPRPLPVWEAEKIAKKYAARFTVLPGITSSWVVQGSHRLPFDQWMQLDIEYVRKQSIWLDLNIAIKTVGLMLRKIRA